jgi:copper chaperone CopZ
METEEITIKGMHCQSCEKTLRHALEKDGISVESISHKDGKARIRHEHRSKKEIDAIIKSHGYELAGPRRTGQSLMAATYATEKAIATNGLLALCALLILQIALAYKLYPSIPGYRSEALIPLLILPVAIVVNAVALWHQRAYRRDVSCMTGMMIGMTIGMTSGFLIGAIAGLFNGMFFGALIGLAVGMAAGAYAGKCCGIMGVMEGMMAGLMGGTMGAMLTIMMIAQYPVAFITILTLLCAAILAGLMIVIMREHAGCLQEHVRPWPLLPVLIGSAALMIALSAIMLTLPRGLW